MRTNDRSVTCAETCQIWTGRYHSESAHPKSWQLKPFPWQKSTRISRESLIISPSVSQRNYACHHLIAESEERRAGESRRTRRGRCSSEIRFNTRICDVQASEHCLYGEQGNLPQICAFARHTETFRCTQMDEHRSLRTLDDVEVIEAIAGLACAVSAEQPTPLTHILFGMQPSLSFRSSIGCFPFRTLRGQQMYSGLMSTTYTKAFAKLRADCPLSLSPGRISTDYNAFCLQKSVDASHAALCVLEAMCAKLHNMSSNANCDERQHGLSTGRDD